MRSILTTLMFVVAIGLSGFWHGDAVAGTEAGSPIRRAAIGVVQQKHGGSLDSYILVELFADSWARFIPDSGLGPHIEFAKSKDSAAIALFIFGGAAEKAPIYCVYFDGLKPTGLTRVYPNAPTAQQLAEGFQAIGAVKIPDGEEKLIFEPVELEADNGTPVPAVFIRSGDGQATSAKEYDSRLDKARALYKLGPSKAPEIIAVLEEELQENPGNLEAIKLLAVTYRGAGQFERALQAFDTAIEIDSKEGVISPRMLFYKAQTLHFLERNAEASEILQVYWAFFQGDVDVKAQYDELVSEVNACLETDAKMEE